MDSANEKTALCGSFGIPRTIFGTGSITSKFRQQDHHHHDVERIDDLQLLAVVSNGGGFVGMGATTKGRLSDETTLLMSVSPGGRMPSVFEEITRLFFVFGSYWLLTS